MRQFRPLKKRLPALAGGRRSALGAPSGNRTTAAETLPGMPELHGNLVHACYPALAILTVKTGEKVNPDLLFALPECLPRNTKKGGNYPAPSPAPSSSEWRIFIVAVIIAGTVGASVPGLSCRGRFPSFRFCALLHVGGLFLRIVFLYRVNNAALNYF